MADEELPSYTPQAISDLLPIYRPEESEGQIQTYILRHISSSTQVISPKDDSSAPSYIVKAFATGGFLNKKPHMIISKTDARGNDQYRPCSSGAANDHERRITTTSTQYSGIHTSLSRRFPIMPRRDSHAQPGCQVSPGHNRTFTGDISPHSIAEARFAIYGTHTTIDYTHAPPCLLVLENSQAQILRTTIDNVPHWWRPFPGNKCVVELLTSTEEIVARFVYSPPPAMSSSAATGRKGSIAAKVEVGDLHIVEALAGGERGKEEIICSAAVLIERAKRRAANMQRHGVGFRHGPTSGSIA
ncbi:MAG: hypothetical protein Q9163_004986 [Psora crenata]